MAKRNKNKKPKRDFASSKFAKFLDGSAFYHIILKDLRFVLFCVALVFFYVSNRNANDGLKRNISLLEEEITRLRFTSITVSSELMSVSKPSQVARIVKEKGLDLKFSNEPPKVIE